MTVKRTNKLLLISVILGLVLESSFSIFNTFVNIDLDVFSIVKYVIIATICIIILKKDGERLSEYLPYNVPLKIKSALWILVLFIFIQPVDELLCELGGLIFGDTFSYLVENYVVPNDSYLI